MNGYKNISTGIELNFLKISSRFDKMNSLIVSYSWFYTNKNVNFLYKIDA